MIQIIGIKGIPIIKPGDKIAEIIYNSIQNQSPLEDEDIIVIAQSIISRAEGRVVNWTKINPTPEAIKLGKELDKDPRIVSLILNESVSISRKGHGKLIVELESGIVCANAGIDRSNSGGINLVTLLPEDPDKSAKQIKEKIKQLSGLDIGIIISDTHGRPFRNGAINVALGISGFENGILSYVGKKDLFNYELESSIINIVDELASAAELIMGESDEAIPVVLIRGYKYKIGNDTSKSLIREKKFDLFR
ncbi:MAG: coenzyme F420-0:L-glutamate ligase [Candidatus Helarchaeota archaeon]|nr:coenzyme F420-0:L-glutamate ligase [Candidatus Helarchaeota archaeon]